MRGELYGVPLSAMAETLQYDPRLFDAAGLAQPPQLAPGTWTWQTFLDAARRLTRDNDGDGEPDQYGLMGSGSLEMWIWQAGGEVLAPDGRRALVAEPAGIEGTVFYAQLLRSGLVGRPRPDTPRPSSLPLAACFWARPAPRRGWR